MVKPPPSPASPPLPSPSDPVDASAARLDELEIRLSFFEDLLDSLNGLVARQSEQIEALGRELRRLRERLDGTVSAQEGAAGHDSAAAPGYLDERPPHY